MPGMLGRDQSRDSPGQRAAKDQEGFVTAAKGVGRHARGEEGGADRRQRRRRHRRHLLACEDRHRRFAPIVWDPGRGNAKGRRARRPIAEFVKTGLDAPSKPISATRPATLPPANQRGAARPKVEAVYNYPFQNHAHDGADERDGALHTADRCEVWGPSQKNGEAGNSRPSSSRSGLPAEKCDFLQGHPRRRPSAGRRPLRLCAPGRAGRQGDAGRPRSKLDLDARIGGHGRIAASIRSRNARWNRRFFDGQQQTWSGLHMRIAGQSISALAGGPQNLQKRHGPGGVSRDSIRPPGGPNSATKHSERPDRSCHAQTPTWTAGFWRGVNVNHNTIYGRMLHRRVGPPRSARTRSSSAASCSSPRNLAVLNACAEKIGL